MFGEGSDPIPPCGLSVLLLTAEPLAHALTWQQREIDYVDQARRGYIRGLPVQPARRLRVVNGWGVTSAEQPAAASDAGIGREQWENCYLDVGWGVAPDVKRSG